jgi:GTPase SAR1 family protein
LRQVEQKILQYLHKEEPEKWDEVPEEPESIESVEAKV